MAAKSKSRRTRSVVPNWPSSSTAGSTAAHFFKIILPSTMQDMKLRIPGKFVREFGDELSTVAKLTLPYGHIWQVGLKKADNNIWFCDGWQAFVEYHSICYGHFLVFRYQGKSNFHVLVFDKTATEIQYPSSKNCKLEDQVDIMDLDDAKISMHNDKLNEKEMDELPIKHEQVREKFAKKKIWGTSSNGKFNRSKGRERAIQAAKMFKPKNPSFMGIMRPYNMRHHIMYVPAEFVLKCLHRDQKIIKLETSDGGQWLVNCFYRNPSKKSGMNIGRGWMVFTRENNLEEGDVCVFELFKRKPVVLKVTIFRVHS